MGKAIARLLKRLDIGLLIFSFSQARFPKPKKIKRRFLLATQPQYAQNIYTGQAFFVKFLKQEPFPKLG
ncbi:MAG: hypothetical protein LBU16_08055 [Treponema sp.]|jgi:hypothetical protein|nr:hypothetical protein [Treponema sp.]